MVDNRLVYHDRLLPFIAVHFKSDPRLCSLDDAVTATEEVFGDERSDPSPGAVVVSVRSVACDNESD